MYQRVESWHCSRCDWYLDGIIYHESRCCRLLRCHKRRNGSTRRCECQLIPMHAFFKHLSNTHFCLILVRGISRLYCTFPFWIRNMVFRAVGTGKPHIIYLVSNQKMNPKRPFNQKRYGRCGFKKVSHVCLSKAVSLKRLDNRLSYGDENVTPACLLKGQTLYEYEYV